MLSYSELIKNQDVNLEMQIHIKKQYSEEMYDLDRCSMAGKLTYWT